MMGAGAFVFYQAFIDFLRHHDEANSRPMVLDHTAALTIMSMGYAATIATNPLYIPLAGFFTAAIVSPLSWWMVRLASKDMTFKHSNIFYENGTTEEEIERFRNQDEVERLGLEMLGTNGYGYCK